MSPLETLSQAVRQAEAFQSLLADICKEVGAVEDHGNGEFTFKPDQVIAKIQSLKFRAGFMSK